MTRNTKVVSPMDFEPLTSQNQSQIVHYFVGKSGTSPDVIHI